MQVESSPSEEELARIDEALDGHSDIGALALFVHSAIASQAEGRQLRAGREWAERLASATGLEHGEARCELGNVLDVVADGPKSSLEYRLLSALFVRGAAAELEEEGNNDATAARFVRHADWLEAATAYCPFAFVDRYFAQEQAESVWDELSADLEALSAKGNSPKALAAIGRRMGALATSDRGRARLSDLAENPTLGHPARALAASVAPTVSRRVSRRQAAGVRGRSIRPRSRPAVELLRLLTGWAALQWVFCLLLRAMGFRTELEVAVDATGLTLREERFAFGRALGVRETQLPYAVLLRVQRSALSSSAHLALGAFFFALGLLLGGLLLFEGVRSASFTIALVGAAFILVGALCDLGLEYFFPGTAKRRRLDVRAVSHSAALRLDAEGGSADTLLEALRNR